MRHFRFQIAVRVGLLTATLALALYLGLATGAYGVAMIVGVAGVWQVWRLIVYLEKTNRDLSRLLRAIRYADFAQGFTPSVTGSGFDDLSAAFGEVMEDFRKARAEKEEHVRYLQTVVQHVGMGLISFQEDGTVGLLNNAAKRLLRIRYLKNVKALAGFSPALVEAMLRLRSGEKALVKVVDGDDLLQLSIYATTFRLRDQHFTLVSLHNIQSELEAQEFEAWQKLTRVLTHEIMNSITPIASLASTVRELVAEPDGGQANGFTPETLQDVRGAVQTIERRSQNLLHFVQDYRRLTRVPHPNLRIFPVADLFENLQRLFQPELEARNIAFRCTLDPPGLDLTADPELIEQALINLVRNAVEAVEGRPEACITLAASLNERSRPVIQVVDNGPGIIPEALDKLFIPFFTTKKDGSGIGLSLSRQIMRQHGGSLTAVSEPERRTVFTLRF
jgi:nitrogen fixation/metabolism regulation signal transduction histidine kinase